MLLTGANLSRWVRKPTSTNIVRERTFHTCTRITSVLASVNVLVVPTQLDRAACTSSSNGAGEGFGLLQHGNIQSSKQLRLSVAVSNEHLRDDAPQLLHVLIKD